MQRLIALLLVALLLSAVLLGSSWLGLRLTGNPNVGILTLDAPTQGGIAAQGGEAPASVQHIVANPAAQDPVRSVNADETLYLAVSYTQTVENAELAAGVQRIIVTAVLGNRSAQPVSVGGTDLTLLTQDGKRYAPNLFTKEMTPALVAAEVAPNSTLYGFVSFDVASDLAGALLEWCLDGAACQTALQSRLP